MSGLDLDAIEAAHVRDSATGEFGGECRGCGAGCDHCEGYHLYDHCEARALVARVRELEAVLEGETTHSEIAFAIAGSRWPEKEWPDLTRHSQRECETWATAVLTALEGDRS